MSISSPASRRPGRRAGLSRQGILDAARTFGSGTLSMQALATKLGVDPKALNHHVGDRSSLLGLIAEEDFATTLGKTVIAPDADWKDACRAFAIGFADAVQMTGAYLRYLPAQHVLERRFLDLNEAVLARLTGAGFDDEAAVRAIVLLTSVCYAHAHDLSVARSTQGRRRREMLTDTLSEHDADAFPHLARIAGGAVDTYGSDQFLYGVETCIAGLSARLADGRRDPPNSG